MEIDGDAPRIRSLVFQFVDIAPRNPDEMSLPPFLDPGVVQVQTHTVGFSGTGIVWPSKPAGRLALQRHPDFPSSGRLLSQGHSVTINQAESRRKQSISGARACLQFRGIGSGSESEFRRGAPCERPLQSEPDHTRPTAGTWHSVPAQGDSHLLALRDGKTENVVIFPVQPNVIELALSLRRRLPAAGLGSLFVTAVAGIVVGGVYHVIREINSLIVVCTVTIRPCTHFLRFPLPQVPHRELLEAGPRAVTLDSRVQ